MSTAEAFDTCLRNFHDIYQHFVDDRMLDDNLEKVPHLIDRSER